MAWVDAAVLIDLLDRQFEYVLKLKGTPRLMRLTRLIAFLEQEPRVAAQLGDFKVEADTAIELYEAADRNLRRILCTLWETDRADIQAHLPHPSEDALTAHGATNTYIERINNASPATLPISKHRADRAAETEPLIQEFKHWIRRSREATQSIEPEVTERLHHLGRKLDQISKIHEHEKRRLQEANDSLPWPAFARLVEHARLTNPKPPSTDSLDEWVTYERDRESAQLLRRADTHGCDTPWEEEDVDAVYDATERDAWLLHEELRFRIGLGRSRLAVVRRYAARCETFDRPRLLTLVQDAKRSSTRDGSANSTRGHVEDMLTLDFGRYLFDLGFNPLVDPKIAGLRPDLFDPGAQPAIYVEAKQYSSITAAMLRKAVAQVFDTWARLSHQFEIPEAFLVVFRVAGRLVRLPSELRQSGRPLYLHIIDLAPSKESGSRATKTPLVIEAEELLPQCSQHDRQQHRHDDDNAGGDTRRSVTLDAGSDS